MYRSDSDHARDLLSRMEPELESLVDKIGRLDSFLMSESYETLPKDDRMDLAEQWRHMGSYAAVLGRRIERLSAKLPEDEVIERKRQAQQRATANQVKG